MHSGLKRETTFAFPIHILRQEGSDHCFCCKLNAVLSHSKIVAMILFPQVVNKLTLSHRSLRRNNQELNNNLMFKRS